MFPGAQRMNRGRAELGTLLHACRANGLTDLLLLHEHRGVPGEALPLLPPPCPCSLSYILLPWTLAWSCPFWPHPLSWLCSFCSLALPS